MTILALAWLSTAWALHCRIGALCLCWTPTTRMRSGRANVRSIRSFPRLWSAGTFGFGIMGGSNQPLAHAQFVSNIVDYDMNIQAALEAPRFTIPDTGTRAIGCRILVESRIPSDVLQHLREKEHQLRVRQEYSTARGSGQAVLRDSRRRVNFGASDPRADGSAEPEAAP